LVLSRASTTDITKFCSSNITQSNDGSSSIGVIDWSQIEIARANENEIDVPVTEENLCLMLVKEICPRGNNNIVIIIFLVHDNIYIPC
jgi:hypothetical protein